MIRGISRDPLTNTHTRTRGRNWRDSEAAMMRDSKTQTHTHTHQHARARTYTNTHKRVAKISRMRCRDVEGQRKGPKSYKLSVSEWVSGWASGQVLSSKFQGVLNNNAQGEMDKQLKQGRIHGIRCYETPFSAVKEKALRTYERTDGRTDGRTDERTNGRTDGLIDIVTTWAAELSWLYFHHPSGQVLSRPDTH